MKTYAECEAKARVFDIPVKDIAGAFGIEIPKSGMEIKLMDLLSRATTQNERWDIHREAPTGSKIKETILEVILQHVTTQKERWAVCHAAPTDATEVLMKKWP